MSIKLGLFGTCGNNEWRYGFVNELVARGVSREELFNPVLPVGVEWNDEHQKKEDKVKETAPLIFFHLGNPYKKGGCPFSQYSLQQLVHSCFDVNVETRGFVDKNAIKDPHAVKSFTKSFADMEKVTPGLTVMSWNDFVTEVVRLYKENPQLIAFLAGSCGNSTWRNNLLADLSARRLDTSRFINPQVPVGTWSKGVQFLENQILQICTHEFFCIGDPKEDRTDEDYPLYSAVEALTGLYLDARRNVVCFDYRNMTGHALFALQKTEEDMRKRFPQACIFSAVREAEDWIVSTLAP